MISSLFFLGDTCDDPTDLTSQQQAINHINKTIDNQLVSKNNLQHLDALNEKYNLQNYSTHLKNYDLSGAGLVENHQHHHMQLQQHDMEYLKNIKSLDHQGVSPYADQADKNNLENEPNNNTKNNSSSSSYDDVIDYDDSIQINDVNVKEDGLAKGTDSETMKYKCNEYMKSFDNVRSRYDDMQQQQQQPSFNGGSVISDEYRGNSMVDERKMGEDGNSNDMRMNYASSDELNQTTASSDHGGDKAGSGSDDEGNMGKISLKMMKVSFNIKISIHR